MEDSDRLLTVYKDGQEVILYMKDLTLAEREEAESIRIRKWNKAVQDKAIFAEKLGRTLEEQGIWDKEKEQKVDELRLEIIDKLNTLNKGGIKLSEARNLALEIRELRNELNLLTVNRVRYVNETVEGQAQNAEFDYLVSQIAVYNDDRNKKYFANYEEYLNRKNSIDSYMIANKVAEIIYGGGEESYPENSFLRKYKFVDNKLRLVNKDGHLVDREGKLINEYGEYVKIVKGKEVVIDEKGNILESEFQKKPYLDDDTGEPILLE